MNKKSTVMTLFLILAIGLSFTFLSCEQAVTDLADSSPVLNEEALLKAEGVTIIAPTDPIVGPTPAPMLKMTGVVEKVIVYPGTRSEYSYFQLIVGPTDPRMERPTICVILLNEKGRSEGFDLYVKKQVTAVGYIGYGTIGWMNKPVKGLIVKEIYVQTPYIYDEGVVRYIELEGGFYGIVGNKDNYDPINLPKDFMVDGLKVKFTALPLRDQASIHMWGTLIEIIKIEKSGTEIYVNLDQKFFLSPRQTAFVKSEGLAFTFMEVLTDSRCPRDVVCVWEGEAVIAVKVSIKGVEYGPFKMTTRANPSVIQVGGYQIVFLDLLPEPYSNELIPAEKYQGLFYITRVPVITTSPLVKPTL
jgi:hypothetical protein